MTLDELMEMVTPYVISETLEGLGKAKIILDEFYDAHPEEFTSEENNRLHKFRASLMSQMGDLLPDRRPYNDDEDDGILTIRIPAGKQH